MKINAYGNNLEYSTTGNKNELSSEEKTVIAELKIRENEVIAHEQAHKSVGGKFSGAMNYSYTKGPDGQKYISSGEVSMSIPGGEPSEKLIQDLMQVKRAALAPAKPSGQDMSVASSVDSKIQSVKAQLKKVYSKEADPKQSKFDMLV